MKYLPTKASTWEHHVKLWRQSGKTAAEWCREHNLGYNAFLYWKYKLEESAQEKPPHAASFVELTDLPCESSGIELVSRDITIRLKRCFDEQTLQAALRAIARS